MTWYATFVMLRIAVLVIVAAGAIGCASSAPCTSSLACGARGVCGHDGVCRALADDAPTSLSQSVRLVPRDWGVTRADVSGEVVELDDRLEVGGEHDSRVHLAFGPLPEHELVRAVLVVAPWAHAPRLVSPLGLVVARTGPFRRATLTRRRAPAESEKLQRELEPGALRTLHIDVTELVRAARRQGTTRLDLVLRAVTGASASAGGEGAVLDNRPRLDLLVRP